MTKISRKKKIKYPATQTVHWSTGPVDCCDKHARALMALGAMLGAYIVATKPLSPSECKNCINENPQ